MISEKHKQLNKQLHIYEDFGMSGQRWSSIVGWIIACNKIKSCLDYGAGKESLRKKLAETLKHVDFHSYDPAVAELSAEPLPAELVVCTDVLEHVEPERLDDVLDHLTKLTEKFIFLVIPTGPAGKVLADGRNAHLIQKKLEWWLPKLLRRFNLVSLNNITDSIVLLLSVKKDCDLADFCQATVETLLIRYRILSVSFDGLCLTVFVKNRSWSGRVLPRLISTLHLGGRKGVADLGLGINGPVRLNIVKF